MISILTFSSRDQNPNLSLSQDQSSLLCWCSYQEFDGARISQRTCSKHCVGDVKRLFTEGVMKRSSTCWPFVLAVCVTVFLLPLAFAQETTGGLQGTIKD